MDFLAALQRINDPVAAAWSRGYKDSQQAWYDCKNAEWMFAAMLKEEFRPMAAVLISIRCMEIALPIFEVERKEDNRPAEALEAARTYLTVPSELNKRILEQARVRARYASDAAWQRRCDSKVVGAASVFCSFSHSIIYTINALSLKNGEIDSVARRKHSAKLADMIRIVVPSVHEMAFA